MARILQLVQMPTPPQADGSRLAVHDVYELAGLDLDRYRGLLIGGGCDQRFLLTQKDRIDAWVRAGGRIFINGHPLTQFVEALPCHRELDFHTQSELWLSEVDEHPIWAGVDRNDMMFSTGVPGTHSLEALKKIGVAGFYAHAYLVGLPERATTITGIGPGRLPVDISYPLGSGEVMLHSGNDLTGYSRPGTTAADLGERLLAHLEEER